MLFDIEADEGRRVVFYLVPDSGSGTPSVRVRIEGEEVLTLAANERRPHLVGAGRHATGQCGFVLDETLLPGLAHHADLEITEAETELLVYRRRTPHAVEERIFRLETHLRPLTQLDNALWDQFQYWYPGIDRFGHETTSQVFCLNAPSMFVSGHLLLKPFDHYLVRGIRTIGLLRDPVYELAERLLLFKHVGDDAEELLGARGAMTYAPVIDSLVDVELADAAQCRRFLRRLPESALRALSNPLVRLLTTNVPDEMPSPSGVASALDALAGFELLGLRADAAAFINSLAELSQIDPAALPPIGEDPKVAALGESLRGISTVEDILEKDLEVFYVITRAFDGVGA